MCFHIAAQKKSTQCANTHDFFVPLSRRSIFLIALQLTSSVDNGSSDPERGTNENRGSERRRGNEDLFTGVGEREEGRSSCTAALRHVHSILLPEWFSYISSSLRATWRSASRRSGFPHARKSASEVHFVLNRLKGSFIVILFFFFFYRRENIFNTQNLAKHLIRYVLFYYKSYNK